MKHPSSKIAQVRLRRNHHFEEASVPNAPLAPSSAFPAARQVFGFTAIAGVQAHEAPSHLLEEISRFTSQQLSPTALVELKGSHFPFPIPNRRPQLKPGISPGPSSEAPTRAPKVAEVHWPLPVTGSCLGMNFPSVVEKVSRNLELAA